MEADWILSSNDAHKDPVIESYKEGIDRTLIRENLKLTVHERVERLMALQRFAEELERAGRKTFPRR